MILIHLYLAHPGRGVKAQSWFNKFWENIPFGEVRNVLLLEPELFSVLNDALLEAYLENFWWFGLEIFLKHHKF